jgi:copper transport protein
VQRTDPPRNATVAQPPHAVTFTFNEPVEASFGAVRIYNSDAKRVDEGPVERLGGKQETAGVHMRSDAGKGIYTATYRVVSADGHPVEGGFSFGVGVPLNAPGGKRPPQVAKLLEGTSPPASVEGSYGVVRALHYAALLFVIGGAVFAAAIAQPSRRILAAACATGLAASLLAIPLQGLLGSGGDLTQMLDSATIDGSLDTRTGAAWAIRAGIWAVALLICIATREGVVLAFPALALAVSMPLGGHAWTQSPRAVLVPADLVHVAAAGTWLGGLLLLFMRRASNAEARVFSGIALPAIAALTAAGAVQAWFYLEEPGDFFTDAYGIALLAKIVLLGAIVGLGALNRRALKSDTATTAGRLRRAMSAEVIAAALVIAATATVVRLAPPAAEASGPDYRNLDLGPLRLQMVIEPQKTGANTAHLYLYDRATGEQFDRAKQLTLTMAQPDKKIGPILHDVPRLSFAHYELRGLTVGVPGTWRIRVIVRVSEFDEYTADTRVTFR